MGRNQQMEEKPYNGVEVTKAFGAAAEEEYKKKSLNKNDFLKRYKYLVYLDCENLTS